MIPIPPIQWVKARQKRIPFGRVSTSARIVAPVVEALDRAGVDYRMLILPDHPTPIRCRTHTADPVPFLLYDSTTASDQGSVFSEKAARESGCFVPTGCQLMKNFIGGK